MRVPSTGRRRRLAAFAAAVRRRAARPCPHAGRRRAPRERRAARRAGRAGRRRLLRGRRRAPAPARPALGRRRSAATTRARARPPPRSTPTCCSCTRSPRSAVTTGPTRADARARSIARFLVGPQVWTLRPPLGADPQVTGPGWVSGPGGTGRHMVYDTDGVDGLVHAYLARDVLGLDRRTVARIRDEIHRVADEPRLALAGAAAEPVQLVLRDVRRRRDRQRRPRRRSPTAWRATSSASCRREPAPAPRPATSVRACASTTCPQRGRAHPLERRLGRVREHRAELLALLRRWRARPGMRPPAQLGLLRDWVRRVIAGYWTHGGYLNWDTGLGFYRWHQRKKVGARAAGADRRRGRSPSCSPARAGARGRSGCSTAASPRTPRWSSARGGSRRRSPTASTRSRRRRGNAYLAATRTAANALRALEAGLGARAARAARRRCTRTTPTPAGWPSPRPPTTPRSSPVNQRAFPYGGLDIARLFDGRQEVAANIGGVRHARRSA